MRESIKMRTPDFNFKFRVSGIVLKDNKVLLVDMDNSGFLCLPGGYVELGETTEIAILREMQEEVSKKFSILKYCGIIENFFVNKRMQKMHEIAFYYLVSSDEFKDTSDFNLLEIDKGREVRLSFKWVPLNELDNYDIRPPFLKDILIRDNLEFKHLVVGEIN